MRNRIKKGKVFKFHRIPLLPSSG